MSNSDFLVRAENVHKSYPGFEMDLSMDLPDNRITGIVGLNGAGKTTLFKILLGLIPAQKGTVEVFDHPVQELSASMKAQIGVVLSDSFLSENLKIKTLPGIYSRFYPDFDPDFFEKEIRAGNLDPDRQIRKLSTGQKARLKVICALSIRPRLLVLDEPTAGLDVLARREILDLLRGFMEEPGKSILISSHISSDLETLCDDFCLIHDGKILLKEDMDQLMDSYGILDVDPETWESLDKSAVKAWEPFRSHVEVLVSDRRFYEENYPKIQVEKGNVDDMVELMIRGKRK